MVQGKSSKGEKQVNEEDNRQSVGVKTWMYNAYRTATSNYIISKQNVNLKTTPFFKPNGEGRAQVASLLHLNFVNQP
jgi:hypothetical protein